MARKLTTEEFIAKARAVHGDKYDYSKVKYTTNKKKVTIICPKHGEFEQAPNNHLLNNGCSECTIEDNGIKKMKKSAEKFVTKANQIHKNKYDYSKTKYTGARYKITITCPEHGDFTQRPHAHLQGQGCPECGKEFIGWTYTNWENAGNNSTSFKEFYVYVIECWNDDERFIKIGKTYTAITRRFAGNKIPYEWKLLKKYEGSARYISELEAELHSKYKEHRYIPNMEFGGMQECFNINVLELDELQQGVIP